MLLLLSATFASEPGASLPSLPAGPPGVAVEVVVPWSVAGLVPAGPEQPAFGPDRLAIGPDGAWAAMSVPRARVIGSFGELPVAGADALAFTEDGDLLVLAGRRLTRYAVSPGSAAPVAGVDLPGLVPPGVGLSVEGEEVVGVDVFGNLHPVARAVAGGGLAPPEDAALRPGPAVRRTAAGEVTRDGEPVARGALAARPVGACVLVERGVRGAVTARELVCAGRVWALPLDGVYRPFAGVAAWEDVVAWLDPRADGLHVTRVSP